MRNVVSVRSAAELAGVTESAISQAVTAGRVKKPLIYYTGSRPTNWICLDSLKKAYRLTAADVRPVRAMARLNRDRTANRHDRRNHMASDRPRQRVPRSRSMTRSPTK